jgi:hypothetical protein
LSINECVLHVRGDFATQLRIAEVLKLNRDCHHVTILSNTQCPVAVQSGQTHTEWTRRRKHPEIMLQSALFDSHGAESTTIL